MMGRDEATEAQVRAADPAGSVWLSANAGSGKTRVLIDRVARLLLDGVPPQRILCLTYTRAAASEMQNRLFGRLGEWAMQDENRLRRNLEALGAGGGANRKRIAEARRLFAYAIETPGGLKIQTIHSFCASLLRRFPLEAGVSPQFVEMDDRSARLLCNEIVESIADGENADVLDRLADHLPGDDLSRLMADIVKERERLGRKPDRGVIRAALGVPDDESEERILDHLNLLQCAEAFAELRLVLSEGSSNDLRAADKIAGIDPFRPRAADLPVLENVLLFGATAKAGAYKAKIGSFPTRASRERLGDFMPAIEELMARTEGARERRIALIAAEKTLALYEFAHVFLQEYEARKQARGWLDFDDLILKTRTLLTDSQMAQWVLFRLDGGIDHILVDEAQDTSPVQWQVIERLAHEFTAGQGARTDTHRTVFVVGDKKQSIYSFQGADPSEFDRMGAHFETAMKQAHQPFAAMRLEHSFRSATPVLKLVDSVFGGNEGSGLGDPPHHIAFKATMPGRVDLWPAVPATKNPEPDKWYDPVDRVADNHHSVVLAERIADWIAGAIGRATIPEDDGSGGYKMRHVRAGDILILVQRRSELFHEIIRACKSGGRNLSIAGADRLRIGAELAVRDIAALLSFLSIDRDDLSLAAALRSPLFGWTQQELHILAQPREHDESLWDALRRMTDSHPRTLEVLNALRRETDFLRPYDLIERILNRHGGRRRLLARLGIEAEDGMDALLDSALAYEHSDIPSLTGFLTWLASDEIEIKRQLDSAGDRIRVMTVHGAKGLESPIVILPDTARPNAEVRDEILPDGRIAYWKTSADARPVPLAGVYDHLAASQTAERDRLLYVAMTRAEKWLIVAGAGQMGSDGRAWYEQVRAGMDAAGAGPHRFDPKDEDEGLRLAKGNWLESANAETEPASPAPAVIPNWTERAPEAPSRAVGPLSPSALGGDKALPGDSGLDEEAAMRRGSIIHLLLEHLPQYPEGDWPTLSRDLLISRFPDCVDSEMEEAITEATRVLTASDLVFLFSPGALAEAEISAELPELDGQRIRGAIDRLVVAPDRILAVDFKTNATVPEQAADVPDGILCQLGAYRAALCRIYPDRPVKTAILWTGPAVLMTIPDILAERALSDAAFS